MATLTVVVGLPGSGKSRHVALTAPTVPGLCVDDLMRDSVGHSTDFRHSRHYHALIAQLRRGRDCLIADIVFCDARRRVEFAALIAADAPGTRLEWVCFENDPRRCIAAVLMRHAPTWRDEVRTILELSARYDIPAGAERLPAPELAIDALV